MKSGYARVRGSNGGVEAMNEDCSLLRLMVGRVIGKTKEAREASDTSQPRFEAIEIIEALILSLVAVATAWSGYQAAE
jgi:hypothetical protein